MLYSQLNNFMYEITYYCKRKGADDAALAADNLVFLPAAGDRAGSSVTVVGSDGFYWSSSKSGEGQDQAYDLHFTGSSVKPNRTDYRYIGCSVRLITESK